MARSPLKNSSGCGKGNNSERRKRIRKQRVSFLIAVSRLAFLTGTEAFVPLIQEGMIRKFSSLLVASPPTMIHRLAMVCFLMCAG
jgi:hypothetical protein